MNVNYILEINNFEDWLVENPMNASEQLLWYKLMAYNNRFGWKSEFSITNTRLCDDMRVTRQYLDKCRSTLINKGLISYRKGTGNQCGIYHINMFSPVDTPVDTVVGTVVAQQLSQEWHSSLPLNKLNKTKQDIKEKNIKKEKYGQLQNVALTAEEFEKLKAEYPDYEERIERLSLYIGSKGDKYKSHYATIKNWARKDGVTTKPKPKDVFALE